MKPHNSKHRAVAKSPRRFAPLALLPLFLGVAPSAVAHDWSGRGAPNSWVEGWGSATVTAETPSACPTSQPCTLTLSGSGATRDTFDALGQFDLQAMLTVALPGATGNGFNEACYPVTGTLTLSPVEGRRNAGSLAVEIQGEDCAVGSNPNPSAIAATYIVDGANSTGIFGGAAGTGTVSASLDTSQSPPAVQFSFSGSLQGTGNQRHSRR